MMCSHSSGADVLDSSSCSTTGNHLSCMQVNSIGQKVCLFLNFMQCDNTILYCILFQETWFEIR